MLPSTTDVTPAYISNMWKSSLICIPTCQVLPFKTDLQKSYGFLYGVLVIAHLTYLQLSFKVKLFLTVHDLKGPFFAKGKNWCCDARDIEYKWSTGAPCIISIPKYIQDNTFVSGEVKDDIQSSQVIFLNVPKTHRKTFQNCSLAVAGPSLWNSLPCTLRMENDFENFKKMLKTHLFKCAYFM